MAGDFWWFLTLRHFEHVVSVVPSDDDSYAIVEMLWWLEVRDAASAPDFWLNSFLVRQSLSILYILMAMQDLTEFWVFPL